VKTDEVFISSRKARTVKQGLGTWDLGLGIFGVMEVGGVGEWETGIGLCF
jgi:hypothetical protein